MHNASIRLVGNPSGLLMVAVGIGAGVLVTGGVVLASSRHLAVEESSPPSVVSADYTVGGEPADLIAVSYLPKGFERSEDEVQTWQSGSQMHSQLYSGESSSVEVIAYRRPEPLDHGADLGFSTDVTNVSLGEQSALLLTASDGNDETAVVEWQSGPTIVKVIGNHLSVDELMKVARGVSVTNAAA